MDQHWADLLEALRKEVTILGGYGDITIKVRFHDSQPREIEVRERHPKYLLGTKEARPQAAPDPERKGQR